MIEQQSQDVMPSLEDIVQMIVTADSEEPAEDKVEESEHECVPLTMAKVKSAIDEIRFTLS